MLRRFTAVIAALLILFGNTYIFSASGEKLTLILETEENTENVKKAVMALDGDAVIMPDYDTLFYGFAVTLSAEAAKKVGGINGVIRVWQSVPRMQAGEDSSGIAAALGGNYKYRGEGMVAAVIDSSFDVKHELFTLTDPQSGRIKKEDIEKAIDGDLTVTNFFCHGSGKELPYINEKIPYAFDYSDFDTDVSDNDSHGTHVAGIIAANNKCGSRQGFDGVAPEAQLLLMKAGQDNTDLLDDYAILYAIEDAVALGADVINMSFSMPAGSSEQLYGSFDYGKAMKNAEELGVVFICAAGNENIIGKNSNYDKKYGIDLPLASNPDYGLVGSPSTFRTAMSVASLDSDYIIANKYIESSSGDKIMYQEPDIAVDFTVFGGLPLESVAVPGAGEAGDYSGLDVCGKVALIKRGSLTFNEKIQNAAEAGAVAAVIYNNEQDAAGLVIMDLDEKTCPLPAVFISYEDGVRLKNNAVSITFVTDSLTAFRSPTGGQISSFSSRGLTPDLALKPEITAPGGNIYSTIPSGYGIKSGTSMAAPYTAGAALLVRQMLAETGGDPTDTAMIRRILMSTAVPVTDSAAGTEYSPRTQGAGLIDIEAALDCEATVYGETSLAKVELGDMLGCSFVFDFNVRNETDSDIIYDISASVSGDEYEYIEFGPAGRNNGRYFVTGRPAAFRRAAIKLDGGSGADINRHKSKGTDKITVPANSYVNVKINVEIDPGTYTRYKNVFENGFYVEGFVYLTPSDGTRQLSLPYIGFCGDWSDPPVFEGKVNSEDGCFYTQKAFSYADVDGELYMYDLGRSLFLENDNVNAAVMAISPDGDGNGDYIALALTPLRNITDLSVVIESWDGEVVFDGSDMGGAVKSYYDVSSGELNYYSLHYLWDGSDIRNVFYSMPDGKYLLTVHTEIDEGRAAGDWSMRFTVDTADPELVNAYLTRGENGELYLNAAIRDNGYLQYAVPYTAAGNLSDAYAPAAADAVSYKTLRFDITDAADCEYIYFDIADFAMNVKTLRLSLDALEIRD